MHGAQTRLAGRRNPKFRVKNAGTGCKKNGRAGGFSITILEMFVIMDAMVSQISFNDYFRARFRGNIKTDEPMVKHTTMRVGGDAPIFLEPEDEESLVFAVTYCTQGGIPFFILGGGSNVIAGDKIDFAVISTKTIRGIERVESAAQGLYRKAMSIGKSECTLRFGAGLTWGAICAHCKKEKLLGVEKFSGLPGTVGGAVSMNATCFGFSACDRLVSVRYLDLDDLKLKEYTKSEIDFGYKRSPFQRGKLVLSADFTLEKDDSKSDEEMTRIYQEALGERAARGHFMAASAGSIFKNIPEKEIIAGKLIDECGLKGTKIGGAKVADFHGNFIINPNGTASSADVRSLIELVREEVRRKTGIELECEVVFA